MEPVGAPKSEPLRAMYWRSEILQVLFWLRGEGLGDSADARLLERFLSVEPEVIEPYLRRLADEGLVDAAGDGSYRLSERGAAMGAEEFTASFSDLTRPAHGECGADCWCRQSPEEAEACAAERAGHRH